MMMNYDFLGLRTPTTKADYQRLWWVTRDFRNETELQNAIELILKANGITHNREHKSYNGSSRADFSLWDKGGSHIGLFLEAKVETKSTSFDRALGQALRNAVDGFRKTWVVIPDDVKVMDSHVRPLQAIGCDVVRIGRLNCRLQGFNAYDKQWGDFGSLDARACVRPIENIAEIFTARRMPSERHKELYRLRYKRREPMEAA